MTETTTVQGTQVWEYDSLTRKSDAYLLKDLNEFGKEGWELVSTTYHKDMKGNLVWTAIVKRPCAGVPVAAAPAAEPAAAAAPQAAADPAAPAAGAQPAAAPKEGYQPAGFDLTDGDFDFKD